MSVLCNIVSYADSNTPYVSGNDIDEIIESLREGSSTLFTWFTDTIIKRDAEKLHLLVSTIANVTIKIDNLI